MYRYVFAQLQLFNINLLFFIIWKYSQKNLLISSVKYLKLPTVS